MRQIKVIKTVHCVVNEIVEKFGSDKEMPRSYLYLQILNGSYCRKNETKSGKKKFSLHYKLFTFICPTIMSLIYYLSN